MDIGHHKSYDRIMALAADKSSVKSTKLMFDLEDNPLELSILGYGLYCYLKKFGDEGGFAEDVLKRVYETDDFWITYAYLGARNDLLNGSVFII